jgi:nucleotide-binding universal stress UspA family protein
MKKILIAIDYDPTAQKVAESGFELGKAMNAEITLIHVVADEVYYTSTLYDPIMGFPGYINTSLLSTDANDSLIESSQNLLNNIKTHLRDDRVQTIVVEGDFAKAILEYAKNSNTDVIVLGSHSKKWLEKITMGSVTEEVLSKTAIPLFIVPTKKQ